MLSRKEALAVACFTLLAATLRAEDDGRIHGVVRDAAGLAIAAAEVTPRAGSKALAKVMSSADGSFAFDPRGNPEGRVEVRAPGFAAAEGTWSRAAEAPLVIVLTASTRREEVTVTAARGETRLGDTAARVVVVSPEQLQATAAPTLDDALRQVPGFSLFRRSDSRVANPTSQGASLRGVGPSGASRTLVLLDGVPQNDAFGGWIYWGRVPRIGIERVEVLEGGASELYGSAALGGVIQAVGRSDSPSAAVELSGGGQATGSASAYAAGRRGDWGLRFSGEAFTSDGYVLVADDQRGPVDTEAGGRHLSGGLTIDRRLSSSATLFVHGDLFGESRTNGTPLQVNDTDWQAVSAGFNSATGSAGDFSLRAWYGSETYHQTFTSVSAARTSESLIRLQRVPSWAGGFALQWSKSVGSRHALLAGIDGRLVEGRSDETVITAGRATSLVSAGGRERTLAAFAMDRLALGSRTLVTIGARLDRWSEEQGSSSTTPLVAGTPTTASFPPRDATAVSPRVSILFRAASQLRLTAAGYSAFRAPTLNELYRSFRVGDTQTLANPALTEEKLRGGEAGLVWSTKDERLRLRGVFFSAEMQDPVANVTLSTTPTLTTRQRQNLGQTVSKGVSLDAVMRLGRYAQANLGYAFVDATVDAFPANPALVGNQLPQVPRHRVSFDAHFSKPRLFALDVQGRTSSQQYEDDQNQLALGGYFVLDAQLSRAVGRRFAGFMALENITGRRIDVGLTPVRTVGPPRSLRAGVRLDWRGPGPAP